MFRKFLVVVFTILFAVGSVSTIFLTETYGTLKNRDFYTEKLAPEGYDLMIHELAESLSEEVFTDLSIDEVVEVLKDDVSKDDFSVLLGTFYDDLNAAVVEDGELMITISFADLPEDLIFTFEVGEDIEGNFVEYISGIFNMFISVVWAFLLLLLALIALVVLKPWHKILKAELGAIFVASLLLSISALSFLFLPVPDLNIFSFFVELVVKDVSTRILLYAVPVLFLAAAGRFALNRYIKGLDAER